MKIFISQTIHVWYTYIYHKSKPNVGKYTIHGWYGLVHFNPQPKMDKNISQLYMKATWKCWALDIQKGPNGVLGVDVAVNSAVRARVLWWKLLGNPGWYLASWVFCWAHQGMVPCAMKHLHHHIPTKHLSSVSRKVLGNCPAQVTTPSSASRFPSKDRSLMLAEPTWSVEREQAAIPESCNPSPRIKWIYKWTGRTRLEDSFHR